MTRRAWTVVIAGVAYVVVGMVTAKLAGQASTPVGVKGWRLAGWLLSLVVFLTHVAIEIRRRVSRRSAALHVALAVAIGAFGVAALGPFRSHWSDPDRLKLAALSLVAWPIGTGLPAFIAAWVICYVFGRPGAVPQRSGSPAA